MNKVYTAQEVADKLKIKKSTVYDLIKRGELPSSKVGKQLRVSEEQLSQYLNSPECSSSSVQSHNYQPESSLLKRDYLLHSSGLIISGQASPALDLLLNQLPTHPDSLPILQSHMNTYNGLYSLYFEKVHIACASASPEDIHSLVPGVPLTVISLCQYPVGFYVKKENPKNIRGFSDLTRADIIFANREKGSSRRILLDRTLLSSEISPDSISGYRNELVTDHSTAAAVAGGQADIALGEACVARSFPELDFLPVCQESLFLVMQTKNLSTPGFQAVAETIASEPFRRFLSLQTGYDTTDTGNIRHIKG